MASSDTARGNSDAPSSTIKQPADTHLVEVAKDSLGFFADTADAARAALATLSAPNPDVFASMNTLTTDKALKTLTDLADDRLRNLMTLCEEPAIARVVVRNDTGKEQTIFISRASPVGGSFGGSAVASYRAPIGRLAALPVGSEHELRTPGGVRNLEIIERASLKPSLSGYEWDALNSRLEGADFGPLTIVSLRRLLSSIREDTAQEDLLESLLAQDRVAANVLDGLRRSVITKMTLRDQPLLDEYQDEIFRLSLDSRLSILGPPGTGKTTTLIKRLGLKLDPEYLTPEESELVKRTVAGQSAHSQSWLMFTPTELLKQYVKEAFAREGIAASDLRIQTWSDYRRELARNKLGMLRTSSGGSLVLKDHLDSLQDAAVERQAAWFGDFEEWQAKNFWAEIDAHALRLAESEEASIARLGKRLGEMVATSDQRTVPAAFLNVPRVSEEIQTLLTNLRNETDARLRKALSSQLTRDARLLDSLQDFVATLEDGPDDRDDLDADDDEEEEVRQPRIGREAAFDAYARAMRAHARALASKRSLGRQSRNGRIVEWLADRSLPQDELRSVGASLQVQASLRRFVNPARRYISGMPARYRRFRRERKDESRWYRADGFAANELGPLELDAVLLATLRAGGDLLANPLVQRDIDQARYGFLKAIRDLYRTQIMVDEATDFAPIQLACMSALCDPACRSFVACGDFNQRITRWGTRSEKDLQWVFRDIEIRSVNITYRHSRQLNDLARRIVLISTPDASEAQLPRHVDNEGVAPILGTQLTSQAATARWLADRIKEIERFAQALPSIAVLVSHENEVQPVAGALNEALSDQNIRAMACPGGQVVGQENDVRVFDVQHIKGLEFEAVFFVNVDRLADGEPELFDKYLYVGATRAATYLGLTIGGAALPPKIASLQSALGERWT